MDRYVFKVNKRRDVAMIFDTAKTPARILTVTQQTTAAYQVCVEMNRQERDELPGEVCGDCGAEIHPLRPGLCMNCRGVGR